MVEWLYQQQETESMFICAILEDGYPYETEAGTPVFSGASADEAREAALSWFLTAGSLVTRAEVAAWEAQGRVEFYVWGGIKGA